MPLEPIEVDDTRLIVRGTYGRKDQGKSVWVARIEGLDPKFTFSRTFLGESRTVTINPDGWESWTEQHVIVPVAMLRHNDLLQVSTGKWQRSFWRVLVLDSWRIEALDEDQFRQLLGMKLAKPEGDPERVFRQ